MSKTVLGIDIGGTKMAVGRYHASTWELEEEAHAPTQAKKGFSHALDAAAKLAAKLRTPSTVAAAIGVAGLVERPRGAILRLPNIPGGEGVTEAHASVKIGLPTRLENDANCFAFAEAKIGAGQGHRVVMGIAMGTGVGGGIIIDGKIFTGSHGYAAEVGHMLLIPGQTPYPTDDARGEVEQFLSGTAFGKRCTAAERPEDYLEGAVCSFLQPQVFQEVGWLCTSLTHLLDPSIIVFGGSAGRALGPHLNDVRGELEKWILPGMPLPELAVAVRGDAAMLGAAMLAAESARR